MSGFGTDHHDSDDGRCLPAQWPIEVSPARLEPVVIPGATDVEVQDLVESPTAELIREAVRRQTERITAAIERACEVALQSGVMGVRVTHHPVRFNLEAIRDYDYYTVEATIEVAYGTITYVKADS